MFRPPTKYSEYLQDVRKSIDYILSRVNSTTVGTLQQVTNAGSTTTNAITTGGITTDYVQLNTLATPTLAPGMFAWNDAFGTADLRLKGGNVTLQLGQETLARVVNKTGADLLESQYRVVRVRIASEGGSQGQRLAVVLAQGNNDPDSVTTLGIVTETILNNQEGFITVFGNVNNIDTTGSLQGETWLDGDVLCLSPTIPGALTKVKPIAPNHSVTMGYVIYAHGVNGKIFVKVDNGYELDELHNVRITAVANNDLLQYDSVQQVWKNVAASVAVPTPTLAQVTTAGNTTTNAITVGGLTVATNLIYTDLVNNRVGINTASPTRTLDVNGTQATIRASSTTATNSAGIVVTNSILSRDFWFGRDSSVGNGFGMSSPAYAGVINARGPYPLYIGANDLNILSLLPNGNVLIGTTTDAGYKLDVNGLFRLGGAGGRIYSNSSNILSMEFGNTFFSFGPDTMRLSANSGGFIELSSNYTARLRVAPTTGNILIGTTTDGTAKLTVAGSVTAASALAQGVYFNNTLVQAAASDVLTAFQITPTFTVNQTLLHNAYWMRFTGAYSPAAYNNPNNNATTIDLSNSFVNTFNAVGIWIRPTISNVQNAYGIIIDNTQGWGVYQSNASVSSYFRGLTYLGDVTQGSLNFGVNNATLNVANGTNGGIKIGTVGNSEHLILSHSQAGATFSSIRNTYNSASAAMLIDVAAQGNLRLFGTGNVTVGSATDAGYKLDVAGTFRYTGGGFFQGGTNTPVSIGAYMMTYVSSTTSFIHAYNNTSYAPLVFRASTLSFYSGQGSYGQWGLDNTGMNLYDAVSGVINHQWARDGVARSSGTTPYVAYTISPVINNTGTYSGIVRGIYYNPTLTSVTGTTHRAIETTSGDVVFNGGNVGIGTPTPTELLHIVNNTTGNKFARISAGAADASAAWVAQNDQVDNIVYRVFGSGVAGFQMGIALARSASLIANLDGTGKFLIGTYSNTDIIFGTGDQSRIRVSGSNGNVMIGTLTDLGTKLNVSGEINSAGYRVNNVFGWSGTINIPTTPPISITVDGGIITNVV